MLELMIAIALEVIYVEMNQPGWGEEGYPSREKVAAPYWDESHDEYARGIVAWANEVLDTRGEM